MKHGTQTNTKLRTGANNLWRPKGNAQEVGPGECTAARKESRERENSMPLLLLFLKSLGQAPSRELSTESVWVHVCAILRPRQALGTGRVPGYSAMDPGQNIL